MDILGHTLEATGAVCPLNWLIVILFLLFTVSSQFIKHLCMSVNQWALK